MLEKKQKKICRSVRDWGIAVRRKVFRCSLSDVIENPLVNAKTCCEDKGLENDGEIVMF